MDEYEISERLKNQIAFIKEIDNEKNISRQTLVSNGERYENDAEHAWHMAIMAILLAEYSNNSIDILKTVTMLLIHDIVEIDAGDTYAYDDNGRKTQKAREMKAANRIFNLLPEDQAKYFYELWLEFEARETPESKFAHSMDNIQPTILNDATDGAVWKERKIRLSQVLGRNKETKNGSDKLWDFQLNKLIMPNVENGNIINDMNK